MLKRFLVLLAFVILPFTSVYAQEAPQPTAEQLLAADLLNNDDDPNNDVTDPTTLSQADAVSVINTVTPAALTAAISRVTANMSTADATIVAAVAARHNPSLTPVQAAQATGNPNVTTAAVASIQSRVASATATTGTAVSGTGAGGAGGGGGGGGSDVSPG